MQDSCIEATREGLAVEAGQSIKADRMVDVLDRLASQRGVPKRIYCDNGPEFVSKTVDKWAPENAVTLVFSRSGKPTDNMYIESFNGRFRGECLNAHWFLSLDDARKRSKHGAGITMRVVLTCPWGIKPPSDFMPITAIRNRGITIALGRIGGEPRNHETLI